MLLASHTESAAAITAECSTRFAARFPFALKDFHYFGSKNDMSHRFYALYMSVKSEVSSALRSARLGEKDRARERLRFIQNSRLIDILRDHEFPPGFPVNVRLLEWEFLEAMKECTPDAVSPDGNRDLFEAILSRLDLIAYHLSGGRK